MSRSTSKVRKVVFPVAGLGTRFLPATKATPKEMLPVVDKPLIQYAAEEAIAAGITDLVFVTGRGKREIEDHFDRQPELERDLRARDRQDLLDEIIAIPPPGIRCVSVRQPEPLGLGHAVLCAVPAVGDEPFAVILPDDLIVSGGKGCLAQMLDAFAEGGRSLVAVERINRQDSSRYGIVSVAAGAHGARVRIDAIVEKPAPAEAPSDLGVVGRYVLSPAIFAALEKTAPGAGGEIQLTDAIASLLATEGVDAYRFEGKRYDCGSKMGFLQATVELALQHPELGEPFQSYLAGLLN